MAVVEEGFAEKEAEEEVLGEFCECGQGWLDAIGGG